MQKMNKIIVLGNRLEEYEDDQIKVSSKEIYFKKNGDYTLEYVSCDQVQLHLVLLENVFVKLFIFSKDQEIQSYHHYELGENSELLLFQFYQNKMVSEEKRVDLNGRFSKFYQGFSSISCQDEEYHIIVNHNHKDVCSDISNRCIGLDGSRIHMIIDSVLMKGNMDCKMNQTTRILTLGDVDAKIVPNMFIHEDSVEAKHGSIIGGFQEEEIFYLMSRGISYEEAVNLLIKGFVFSNLVVDMEKRAMIFRAIQDLRR